MHKKGSYILHVSVGMGHHCIRRGLQGEAEKRAPGTCSTESCLEGVCAQMIFYCVRCSPILYHSARDCGAILNSAYASIVDVTVTSQTDCPRAACRHGSSATAPQQGNTHVCFLRDVRVWRGWILFCPIYMVGS